MRVHECVVGVYICVRTWVEGWVGAAAS